MTTNEKKQSANKKMALISIGLTSLKGKKIIVGNN
jgi:hypothetical protein